MKNSWPTKLGEDVNKFTFAKLDPDANPPLTVTTWSNLFGQGGSVNVDAKVTAKREDGTTYDTHATLASIRKEHNGSVLAERKHLQGLLDEWNENAEANWRNLVQGSRERTKKYYERRADETTKKLSEMDAGAW